MSIIISDSLLVATYNWNLSQIRSGQKFQKGSVHRDSRKSTDKVTV